jgi:N4-gp56 family major capsid protein
MALMTLSTSGLSSAQMAFVFSKKLLDYARQRLVMNQFGDDVTFQKNQGSKVIRWLRPDAGDRSQVQTLSEGVPLATYREIAYTAVEATLVQYGELSKFSDQLTLIELYPTLRQSIDTLGEDSAQHADFIVMTEVVTGIATGNKMYAQGITSFNNLVAATASGGALTLPDVLRAMTKLQITRAPMKNGEFVCIVPPQVAFDLMQDSKFINAGQYGTIKGLFTGEVGRWYNCRVIVQTQPWIEANTNGTEGTYSAGGAIYSSIVTGRDAYGVPKMAGLDEQKPRMYINDQPDKSDNLNQFVTCGWKSFWAAKTLNNTWSVVLRSKTTFA